MKGIRLTPSATFTRSDNQAMPFLPFLYSTRTLQNARRLLEEPSVNRRWLQTLPKLAAQKNNLIHSTHGREPPSDVLGTLKRFSGSSDRTNTGRSTVTRGEQAVFDRIFGDLSRQIGRREDDDELDKDEILDGPTEDENPSLSPEATLSSMFEAAIANTVPNAALKDTNSALDDSNALETEDMRELELKIKDAALLQAGEEHSQAIMDMLRGADTDVEVWCILEREAFSLIPYLEREQETEQKARMRKLRRKTKSESTTDSPDPPATKAKTKGPITPRNPKSELTSSLPDTALASIARAHYGSYCLAALRRYRQHFPFTPYALHLLNHIRSLGPISYVLGASTHLYNETIYQRWSQYQDYHGVADLLQEMQNQGLEPDYSTYKLLQHMVWEHWRAFNGEKGEAKKVWHVMRRVQEGRKRVNYAFLDIKHRLQSPSASSAFKRIQMQDI